MIQPAYLSIPPRMGSYGDEAVDLARLAGLELDAEQSLAVDALLSYGPGGHWAALESLILEARQNGKTKAVLLPVVLFDLFLLPPDRVVWTAHLFRTTRDTFADFCACVDTAEELSKRVKKISYANGEESIELHSGARLDFLARSKGGGRGLGGKRVVMDEALFLLAAAMGALMPVLSARPDPQINYAASAALETSDHLHRLVSRGRAGNDPSLTYVEWCAPGSWTDPPCERGTRCTHQPGVEPGCALDDEDLWRRANHALGSRISLDYVRAERRALPPREFGRERLGWHEEPLTGGGVIDEAEWMRLVDPQSRRHGDVSIALDISPQRDYAAIALYGSREDGAGHMQLLDYRPGTDWILDRLVELRGTLDPIAVAMGRGTFSSLEVELAEADFTRPDSADAPNRGELAVLNSVEMTAACGQMLDAVHQSTLRHIDQPPLNLAVAGAKARELSDTIAWSRRAADCDISPLVAVTLARWAHLSRAHLMREVQYDVMASVY